MHGPIGQDWPVALQSNQSNQFDHAHHANHANHASHANHANELSADQLAAVLSGWSESGHGALSRRLAHAIRGAVAAGLLGDQVRLPPERALATALAVSRSTVTAALDELRGE